MKNLKAILFVGALLLTTFAFDASSQDTMMSGESSGKARPTVAIIRADWCSACKKVEPIIDDLKQQYADKFNYVIFDVSNDETTERAAKSAKALGLSGFFEANKKSTSTIGVFKNKCQVFITTHNPKRADYVRAFDKALK